MRFLRKIKREYCNVICSILVSNFLRGLIKQIEKFNFNRSSFKTFHLFIITLRAVKYFARSSHSLKAIEEAYPGLIIRVVEEGELDQSTGVKRP